VRGGEAKRQRRWPEVAAYRCPSRAGEVDRLDLRHHALREHPGGGHRTPLRWPAGMPGAGAEAGSGPRAVRRVPGRGRGRARPGGRRTGATERPPGRANVLHGPPSSAAGSTWSAGISWWRRPCASGTGAGRCTSWCGRRAPGLDRAGGGRHGGGAERPRHGPPGRVGQRRAAGGLARPARDPDPGPARTSGGPGPGPAPRGPVPIGEWVAGSARTRHPISEPTTPGERALGSVSDLPSEEHAPPVVAARARIEEHRSSWTAIMALGRKPRRHFHPIGRMPGRGPPSTFRS
jgi:hypothetical protein